MDFALAPAQQALRRDIVRFAQAELGAAADRLDRDEAFDADGWARCGRRGLLGLPLPDKVGGGAADPLTTVVAIEALAFGCPDNGLVFAICNHLFACAAPIVRFGTSWQKTQYLPGLARGTSIGAHAMTEPLAGSDTAAIETTARPHDGGGYVLRGRKTYTTNAAVANVFVVFARTSPAPGARSLSAFIIEKGTPGFHVGEPLSKMGLRSAPMAELVFDGCRVSDAQRLGLEGDGMLVFAAAAESERFYLSAAHVGATKRQLQRSVDYANQRRQFGRPIGEFQAIAHKLARIKVDLELAELMLHKIAWLRGRHQPTYFESAAVKLFTSECYVRASQAALEVHGALGYMRSTGIERQLRDALASTLYAGTSDLQREIVAAWLGLEPGRDRKDHDDVRRQAFREAVD